MSKETGNCYEVSSKTLGFLGAKAKKLEAPDWARSEIKPDDEWYLVHGCPTLRRPPYVKYGHAWLEVGEVCYDAENCQFWPKDLYYAVGNIEDDGNLFRYTYDQMYQFLLAYNHYGPWEGTEGCDPIPDCEIRGVE